MMYEHIGWCKEGKHDKVWGIIRLSDWDCVTFWGRRGTKLQTKMIRAGKNIAYELFRKKTGHGYRKIESWELDTVYPEFEEDLKKTAIWAMLKL